MIREGKTIPPEAMSKLPQLVNAIASDEQVVAMFLIGSAVHCKLKPLSDLDFAVLLSQNLNRRERFEKHLDLIGDFNKLFKTDDIDLVILNDASSRFACHVFKTGRLLHCRDKRTLIDFVEYQRKIFLDFRFFRDRFDEAFERGIGYRNG
jgi:predicted nucleotidyltransferase